mmetsp:Transcript_2404/g.7204  ORF Transcript_2404/g.7204 Transcript_2404/m.7204 type:complete len:259 (+) Transcript_2404:761-1537(+)
MALLSWPRPGRRMGVWSLPLGNSCRRDAPTCRRSCQGTSSTAGRLPYSGTPTVSRRPGRWLRPRLRLRREHWRLLQWCCGAPCSLPIMQHPRTQRAAPRVALPSCGRDGASGRGDTSSRGPAWRCSGAPWTALRPPSLRTLPSAPPASASTANRLGRGWQRTGPPGGAPQPPPRGHRVCRPRAAARVWTAAQYPAAPSRPSRRWHLSLSHQVPQLQALQHQQPSRHWRRLLRWQSPRPLPLQRGPPLQQTQQAAPRRR